MEYYLFVVDSATEAQRIASLFRHGGFYAAVQRLPTALSRQGCTYAVRVPVREYEAAQRLLRGANLSVRRVVLRGQNGYQEVDT